MKRTVLLLSFAASLVGISPAAHADLASFLKGVNDQALADANAFNSRLSRQFGVPMPSVEAIVRTVSQPADAFMVLQLSQMTRTAPDAVLHAYQRSKGRGWGTIAREMGIKPGSPEFHALKRGDLQFTGEGGTGTAQQGGGYGQGHGHGKGKGRGKD